MEASILHETDAPDVPALEATLPFWIDPEAAFVRLYGDTADAFWLDSGPDATEGRSYLGAPSPSGRVVLEQNGALRVHRSRDGVALPTTHRDVIEFLREHQSDEDAGRAASEGFGPGWVGWFGYELGAALVGSPRHPSTVPDAAFLEIDRVVVFDHARRVVMLRVSASTPEAQRWIERTEGILRGLIGKELPPPALPAASVARLRHAREEYLELIGECLAAIRRGDAFQICLTNELRADPVTDPLAVYRRLRRENPSHHGGYLAIANTVLASSSPELFLEVEADGRVRTKPIKGTRRRGADAAEDQRLIRELSLDEKEVAENIMIVDLMRNDLHRIAVPGSVESSGLLEVETYRTVHQLVSTVSARLAPDLSWADVVRACLPGGSMTGAPKHSAMSIIDRLEAGPRGLYAGGFGYLAADGSLELAMTIRSIVMTPTTTTIGAGGGITALSDAGAEFEETLLKAGPLLRAINATIA